MYHKGFDIDDNPFPDGSDDSMLWVDSWLEAERDDMLWQNAYEDRENYE